MTGRRPASERELPRARTPHEGSCQAIELAKEVRHATTTRRGLVPESERSEQARCGYAAGLCDDGGGAGGVMAR
jgi:hypothetical protein